MARPASPRRARPATAKTAPNGVAPTAAALTAAALDVDRHSVRERDRLLARVARIRGQVDGIERLLAADADCGRVLQQLAACRGALNGLMAEILEDHIRHHVVAPDAAPGSARAEAAEQLVDLVRSYLK